MFWLKSEVEKNNNFYKRVKKKNKNQKNEKKKLENIILSIWIEEKNWKLIKLLRNNHEKNKNKNNKNQIRENTIR